MSAYDLNMKHFSQNNHFCQQADYNDEIDSSVCLCLRYNPVICHADLHVVRKAIRTDTVLWGQWIMRWTKRICLHYAKKNGYYNKDLLDVHLSSIRPST